MSIEDGINPPLTYSWPKPVEVPVMKKTRGDILDTNFDIVKRNELSRTFICTCTLRLYAKPHQSEVMVRYDAQGFRAVDDVR